MLGVGPGPRPIKNGSCLGSKSGDLALSSFPNAETLCRLQFYRSSTKLLAGVSFQGIQMGGQIVGASVVKDLCIGMGLVLFSRSCWTLYNWNEERKVRTLYDGLLEKGEIYQDLLQKGLVGVVAEEQEYKTPVQIMNADLNYAESVLFK